MSLSLQLIQFAKWPQPGRVKTRLEPLLGREGALAAHIRLTLDVLANLQASGHPAWFYWDRYLAQPPVEAESILASLSRDSVEQGFQAGEDLGERMTGALNDGLARAGAAVIVGSDCPAVTADYINQALKALAGADVVFGPSDDGGYVLIGARTTRQDMLRGVAWGSPAALEQSMAAVRRAGLRTATLSPLWDVDEPDDWRRYLAFCAQS